MNGVVAVIEVSGRTGTYETRVGDTVSLTAAASPAWTVENITVARVHLKNSDGRHLWVTAQGAKVEDTKP
jgi:hypothetical protein